MKRIWYSVERRARLVWHILRGWPVISGVRFNNGINLAEQSHLLIDGCTFIGSGVVTFPAGITTVMRPIVTE